MSVFSLTSLVYLTVILLNFVLGTIVYLQRRQSIINKVFFWFVLGIVGWLATLFLFFIINDPHLVLLLGRLNFAVVILMVFFGLRFSFVFPEKTFEIKKWQRYLIITEVALLFLITLFTPLVDKNEIIIGESRKTIYGPLYPFFIIHFIGFVAAAIKILVGKLSKLTGIERTRLLYLIWALSLTAIFGFITNILFPLLGYQDIAHLGPFATFFLVGIITYTIIRYRLMDIRLTLGYGAVYLLSFATVIIFASLMIFLNNQLPNPFSYNFIGITTIILGIFLFQVSFNLYEKFASRYFYYTFYNYQKVLTELGKKLTQVLDLSELTELIIVTLINTIKLDRTVVLLREKETGRYQIQKNIGFKEENGISLVKDDFLTGYLEESQKPLIYEELLLITRDTRNESEKVRLEMLASNMKKIEAAVCLPLFIERKIIGMIVLGNKISADPYSQEDIELLTNLSNQASVALQNARLYSQVQDLSKNLREKVDEQTKELRSAYEELKKLDRAKSEFISMASHQLRTPLSSIKGYISMMLEGIYGQPPEKVGEKLKNVFQSNERLIRIVDDLLDISKIELGKMELDKKDVRIEEIISSVCEEIKGVAKEKNINLIWNVPKIPLPRLLLDQLKIRQVLSNVVDNSIKYTKEGRIEINARKINSTIQISVTDTGEGLTPEEQESIFEGFTRGRAGMKLFTEGSGLGLYVAKKYLALHEGKIWAESKGKGKGTTFYITLPMLNK